MILPIFPDDVVELNGYLAVKKESGQVTYEAGLYHAESDVQSFQMITAQFCCNGLVKQADVARAFGIRP